MKLKVGLEGRGISRLPWGGELRLPCAVKGLLRGLSLVSVCHELDEL